MEFVWSQDSSEYAVRDGNMVKIFKNFKEKKTFKPEAGAENIFGGSLLGVRSYSGLTFYDWDTLTLIRRIEVAPKMVRFRFILFYFLFRSIYNFHFYRFIGVKMVNSFVSQLKNHIIFCVIIRKLLLPL